MKTKTEKRADNLSTKDMILNESLLLINENGMLDFRIDVLAMVLNLSPGNITYHFAKKEDISICLWKKFLLEFKAVLTQVSPLLDIKQTYLIFKQIYSIMDDYRGVIMFVNSNVRPITDEAYSTDELRGYVSQLFDSIIETLYSNDYLITKERSKMLDIYQNIVMQWAVNKSSMQSAISESPIDKDEEVSRNAMLALFSLYAYMNEKARKEYDYINGVVRGH